jgi:hypothetical protein
MNAFDDARLVEFEIMKMALPFIGEHSMDGRFVVTDKGRLSLELQKLAGDVVFNHQTNGNLVCVEVKGERRWTGNLFLEVWSNRTRLTPGWLVTLRSDILLYGFLSGARSEAEPDFDTCPFYAMNLPKLQAWAFGHGGTPGRVWGFKEVVQHRYQQLNETVGYVVPIPVIAEAIGMKTFADLSRAKESAA